jgi:hypothetical protein
MIPCSPARTDCGALWDIPHLQQGVATVGRDVWGQRTRVVADWPDCLMFDAACFQKQADEGLHASDAALKLR